MIKTLFLPGASGSPTFWQPVAHNAELNGIFLAWPGLGAEPLDPNVNSIDDLVMLAASHVTEPVNIVAQSMGGVIAIRLALMFPDLVKHLVLTATSGGIPVADLGVEDWRDEYFSIFPNAATWISNPVSDLSDKLESINIQTLLLWGDKDPISPVSIGNKIASLIRNSRLHIFIGANHDLAQTHSEDVAREIQKFLMKG